MSFGRAAVSRDSPFSFCRQPVPVFSSLYCRAEFIPALSGGRPQVAAPYIVPLLFSLWPPYSGLCSRRLPRPGRGVKSFFSLHALGRTSSRFTRCLAPDPVQQKPDTWLRCSCQTRSALKAPIDPVESAVVCRSAFPAGLLSPPPQPVPPQSAPSGSPRKPLTEPALLRTQVRLPPVVRQWVSLRVTGNPTVNDEMCV